MTILSVSPLIDGRHVESESSDLWPVVNPSTGRHLFTIPVGCDADVDQAVISARRAFDRAQWSMGPLSFRKRTLHRFADLIAAHAAELDLLDAVEMGKPVAQPRANASYTVSLMRFYAESVDKVMGDVYSSDSNCYVTQRRLPRGVVGAVVPWNFPTYNAVLKIAPALAAGNCMVLKPSELSSRSAIKLAHLALEAGVPAGVLNIVPGVGHTVGRALGLHADVDMLTFTGSTEVGRQLLQYAGQSNMKTVVAECGGKSPHVVFSDGVDLDAVSKAIAQFLVTNQGQICSVGSRLLVQRSIEGELVEKIAAHAKNIVMGDAVDPTTTFGPLASSKQCARVMDYIESARGEGAELVSGGQRVLQESGGYFVEPTIFRNVKPSARIAQEEIFGPVLSVIPFEDEAEAIRIANGTVYGLLAYIWTSNLSTAMRLANGIRSSVFVNAVAPHSEGSGEATSVEPMGRSGVGCEGGLAGLESYLRRQLVWINHS